MSVKVRINSAKYQIKTWNERTKIGMGEHPFPYINIREEQKVVAECFSDRQVKV